MPRPTLPLLCALLLAPLAVTSPESASSTPISLKDSMAPPRQPVAEAVGKAMTFFKKTDDGLDTVPLEKSPITEGAVRPWSLQHEGKGYRPAQIHNLFYERTHLVCGRTGATALKDGELLKFTSLMPDPFLTTVCTLMKITAISALT